MQLPEDRDVWPAMRVMDEEGEIVSGAKDLDLEKLCGGKDEIIGWYRTMIKMNAMDQIFYDAQRQGRISFYMTNTGEEATHIGSASAFKARDMVYGQYREAGVLMYRGFTLQNFADQCFSNVGDPAKGRQMPVHYGSKTLNFQTISSPLATQIPQASGAAYAYKLESEAENGEGAESHRIVACYFGEGAASEGDFHPALNFAATLECPVVFFCRNNGFAISTPVEDQYRGDGIVSRGPGYGMASVRVDGNDIFAVHLATKRAREIAAKEHRPVLIEAMTYRQGHHSTSDDSTRYREVDEILFWRNVDNPVHRLRKWLEARNWWDDDAEKQASDDARMEVLTALGEAEKKATPGLDELFTDVYAGEVPAHLQRQRAAMEAHVAKYPGKYDTGH